MSILNVGKKRRLRQQAEKQAHHGIPEPYRKSLYEIIQENFKLADRCTYIHRVIYCGEHSFPDSITLADIFEKVHKDVNKEYNMERVTGFVLHYAQYFCVVVEGAEDSIAKHIHLLFSNHKIEEHVGRTKLLAAYHNANKRFLEEWFELTAKPPTLLEKLNPESDIPSTYKIVLNCIHKLYKLGVDLRPKLEPEEQKDEDSLSIQIKSSMHFILRSKSDADSKRRLTLLTGSAEVDENRFIHCLPEYAVLEFIIESPYVQDFKQYASLYGVVPDTVFYEEKVWPVPCDFVPMDVFEFPTDPVTDFPCHLQPSTILN